MSHDSSGVPDASATPWPKVGAIALAAGLVLTVLLLAFTWPSRTAEPRNLPVAVAGPDQATAAVAGQLEEEGTFEVTTVSDRDAAAQLVREREVYGAVVLAPGAAPEVLTATAAGAAPAQVLTRLADELGRQQAAAGQGQGSVEVTDLVPLSTDDRSGAGLAAAAFPLALGGVLGGVLASLLLVGGWQKAAGVTAYALVGGLLVTLVLHGWFGYLQGSFVTAFAAVALTLAATAFVVVGMNALLGRPGLGLAAAFTVLVANPLSGATLPWQFVAEPWGAVGQLLVPGASGALLRSTSYFPDASTAAQWWTLAAWALVGVVLLAVGSARRRAAKAVNSAEVTAETGVEVPSGV